VSKDSGAAGGVADKVIPALERGIRVIMIQSPEE
jgi:precorrin-6x reductase